MYATTGNKMLFQVSSYFSVQLSTGLLFYIVEYRYLHGWIISLRGKNWADKTNLTLPLFIEVPVPSQESKQFNPSTFY
jgi:hypothetical protein